MPVDQLTISGPTLATLLQSVYVQNGPCDGLLLGTTCTTKTTQAHDTSDALVIEETVGRIAAACTCAGTHSFFSNSGQISGDALQQLLHSATNSQPQQQQQQQQQQLLGWFSYRPGTPGIPSMREVAVSRNLQAWMNSSSSSSSSDSGLANKVQDMSLQQSSSGSKPAVFGLITSQTDHNNATTSLQYKFFNIGPPSSSSSSSSSNSRSTAGGSSNNNRSNTPAHPYLQPVDLMVYNLGSLHKGCSAAAAAGGSSSSSSSSGIMQPWGSSALPVLAAVLSSNTAAGSSVISEQQQQELAAAAAAAAAAASAVKGLYEGLLDELQVAAAQVSAKQAQLEELRAKNVTLRQQVMAAAAAAAEVAYKGVEDSQAAADTRLELI